MAGKSPTFLILLVVAFTLSSCLGTCVVEDITVQENVDVSKVLGDWVEYMWLVEPNYAPFMDYHINFKQEGDYIRQTTTSRKTSDATCCTKSNKTKFYVNETPGVWRYRKPWNTTTDGDTYFLWTNTSIISTDYTNYLILYGCISIEQDGTCDRHHTVSKVLTRSPEVSEATNQTIAGKVASLCLPPEDYHYTIHDSGCQDTEMCKGTSGAGTFNLGLILGIVIILGVIMN